MNQWYYRDPQNRKIGPLSDEEFEERVCEGDVEPQTRVWRSGLADWTTYEALLAYEANCLELATGPAESTAPRSSSHSTQVSLGTSAIHRPPTRSCTVTPAATPHGLRAPTFEKCPDCREEVPSHLLREIGARRLCGFCLQKADVDSRRNRLREARGVDFNWLGKFFVRCALIAAAFVLVRVLLFEMGQPKDDVSTLPTVNTSSALMPIVELAPGAGQR